MPNRATVTLLGLLLAVIYVVGEAEHVICLLINRGEISLELPCDLEFVDWYRRLSLMTHASDIS
ncbi:hypothetical protein B296_00038431 [Ensete ventricosum]|uniref:Uncharacterized protein n=1 Tax=Ensete ventricosum TaxID=4639 RepID=A0A426YVY2_ENSVE|nr:hypothetical protein B296_00038431 [Ensete ventricosum]